VAGHVSRNAKHPHPGVVGCTEDSAGRLVVRWKDIDTHI
jgi:hypothetical protein